MDSKNITNLEILAFLKGCAIAAGAEVRDFQDENLSSIHFVKGGEWFRALARKNSGGVFIYNHQDNTNALVLVYKECGLYYFPFDFVRTEIFKLLGHYDDFEYKP